LSLLSGVTAALLLFAAPSVEAQNPVTLRQAVEIALEKNPARKAALAEERGAAASIAAARANLWPHLSFSETFTRGNDPVYVFGTKLRQQRFTLADFDLARLNTPTPINNFNTRFAATWNVFDFRESWFDVTRATRRHEAAERRLDRTEQELVFRVVDAYFALLLAARQLEVAEAALRTAEANLDRSRARVEAGLVVSSDLLSARVNVAARQQERIRAENALAVARLQLNHELGLPVTSVFEPTEILREPLLDVGPVEESEARALAARPDLEGLRLEEAGQAASVSMAKSAFGPRVNLLAGWEADNLAFAGNGGTHWLGGVSVEFDLFQGGAKRARLAEERAAHDRLAALREQAASRVQVEVRRAYLDLGAARQQVELARAAVAEAEDSLRILQNRYEAGLTTITELLRAEEASRRTQTDYWESVYRWQISYANLELATGTLSAGSSVVTQ
jgi:outer membrane protein TolC